MAQRSTGMFPREGFNLDAECEITASAVAASTTLADAKTIRVIVVGAAGIDDGGTNKITVTLGGTGTVGGVFYELVDGPRR